MIESIIGSLVGSLIIFIPFCIYTVRDLNKKLDKHLDEVSKELKKRW